MKNNIAQHKISSWSAILKEAFICVAGGCAATTAIIIIICMLANHADQIDDVMTKVLTNLIQ